VFLKEAGGAGNSWVDIAIRLKADKNNVPPGVFLAETINFGEIWLDLRVMLESL
jgi:hypothetical protein